MTISNVVNWSITGSSRFWKSYGLQDKPARAIPSEWYAYTILHDSYVNEHLSREIMAKLYIGEGTYYRLRRQALRGLTRVLLETGAVAQVS